MGNRIAGRNGRLYASISSGGTAEPITYLTKWTADFKSDRYDVTAQGDSSHVYVAGLPDASGNYEGFYDDGAQASTQFYTAALDGVARKFYFYPSTSSTTAYWFGTAFFDFSVEFPVDGAVPVSGSWSSATSISRVS